MAYSYLPSQRTRTNSPKRTVLTPDMPGSDSDPFGDSAAIFSGHPHISIVTVYRNACWMRIPSLGLVEGDIIALMGGDITPGKVFELLPEETVKRNYLTALGDEDGDGEEKEKEEGKIGDKDGERGRERERERERELYKQMSADSKNQNINNNNNNSKNHVSKGGHYYDSWSLRQDADISDAPQALGTGTGTFPVLNPILTHKGPIIRNGKILEKGTKIHLRARFPDRSLIERTQSKNSGSASDANLLMARRKKSSTYDTYTSKLGAVSSRVCREIFRAILLFIIIILLIL
jgi:hypothetical protein